MYHLTFIWVPQEVFVCPFNCWTLWDRSVGSTRQWSSPGSDRKNIHALYQHHFKSFGQRSSWYFSPSQTTSRSYQEHYVVSLVCSWEVHLYDILQTLKAPVCRVVAEIYYYHNNCVFITLNWSYIHRGRDQLWWGNKRPWNVDGVINL